MKWMLFKIILCGMLVAAPAAIMPMDQPQNQANAPRDCTICFDEKPANAFPALACGHNGACIECIRIDLDPVLDAAAADLREEMRDALRCPNQACRAVPAGNPQAVPPLMQPEDIGLIYADPERPDQAQVRVNRFNEVVRLLNLRRENVQNEAAFNRFLEENPNARRCPTEGCQWAYEIRANQRPANVQCEVCRQWHCSHCRAAHRLGERCRRPEELVQNNNNNPANLAQLTPEERANREWARENIKACPACRQNVNRVGGCNYIRCQCGHEFCWMCLVPDPGHRHQVCQPADLARAERLYGRGAGVPSNANDIYGFNYRPEPEPAIGIPVAGRLPVDDIMDQIQREQERQRRLRQQPQYNYEYNYQYHYEYPPQPAAYPADYNNFQIPAVPAWNAPAEAAPAADQWNHPYAHRRNNRPPRPPSVNGLLILAVVGAGYGVYKLYQYFIAPKIVPAKDIKISLENLLKEATRYKRLVENGTYVRDAFKNYFAQEVKNNAYGNLNAAQLTALKKIVDDLELAFVAGYGEREYLALINFKIALEARKDAAVSHKPDAVQVPVATQQPQVKKSVSKKHTNRRGRLVKRVK